MRWSTALSRRDDAVTAADECVAQLRASLGGLPLSLVMAFFSPGHLPQAGALAIAVRRALSPSCFVGCTAAGVVGGGHEVEEEPCLVLVAAHMPGVAVQGFHVEDGAIPRLSPEPRAIVLLAEPFSVAPLGLLEVMDLRYPGAVTVGGLVSGGLSPEEHGMVLGEDVYQHGVVGVALSGAVEVTTLVSQGCRPLGPPRRITKVRDNLLLGLDSQPPLQVLAGLHAGCTKSDRPRLRNSLVVGLKQGGELLVRNILGVDPESGALALAAQPQEGGELQFMVRDAAAAEEELRAQLAALPNRTAPAGTLLFSCLARGEGLYGRPDVDSNLFAARFGVEAPLAGFFGHGEFGPLGGQSHLHGYTSAFAMFWPGRH